MSDLHLPVFPSGPDASDLPDEKREAPDLTPEVLAGVPVGELDRVAEMMEKVLVPTADGFRAIGPNPRTIKVGLSPIVGDPSGAKKWFISELSDQKSFFDKKQTTICKMDHRDAFCFPGSTGYETSEEARAKLEELLTTVGGYVINRTAFPVAK